MILLDKYVFGRVVGDISFIKIILPNFLIQVTFLLLISQREIHDHYI